MNENYSKVDSAKHSYQVLKNLSIYGLVFFIACFVISTLFHFYAKSAIIKSFLLSSSILSFLVILLDCWPSYKKIKQLGDSNLDRNVFSSLAPEIKTEESKIHLISLVPLISIMTLLICGYFKLTDFYGVLLAATAVGGIFLAFELVQNYLLDILDHELKKP